MSVPAWAGADWDLAILWTLLSSLAGVVVWLLLRSGLVAATLLASGGESLGDVLQATPVAWAAGLNATADMTWSMTAAAVLALGVRFGHACIASNVTERVAPSPLRARALAVKVALLHAVMASLLVALLHAIASTPSITVSGYLGDARSTGAAPLAALLTALLLVAPTAAWRLRDHLVRGERSARSLRHWSIGALATAARPAAAGAGALLALGLVLSLLERANSVQNGGSDALRALLLRLTSLLSAAVDLGFAALRDGFDPAGGRSPAFASDLFDLRQPEWWGLVVTLVALAVIVRVAVRCPALAEYNLQSSLAAGAFGAAAAVVLTITLSAVIEVRDAMSPVAMVALWALGGVSVVLVMLRGERIRAVRIRVTEASPPTTTTTAVPGSPPAPGIAPPSSPGTWAPPSSPPGSSGPGGPS